MGKDTICNIGFASKSCGWAVSLFTILLLPNLFVVFLSSDLVGNPFKQGVYLLFSVLVMLMPSLFMRWRTYFLTMGVFLLFAPIEIGYVLFCKMPITTGVLTSIFHTNSQEASELIGSYSYVLIPFMGMIVLYYWIAYTKIGKELRWTKAIKWGLGGIFIGFNLIMMVIVWKMTDNADSFFSHRELATTAFKGKYKKTYPCDFLYAVGAYVTIELSIKKMNKQLADFHFSAKENKPIADRKIQVLVIGESSRYSNFSINGYSRPTSPRLDSLSHLISYSKAGSEANLTEVALQLMLTRATSSDYERAHKEKALTDAFMECGYKTAWIGNQSANYGFVQRISRPMDYRYFSTTDFGATGNYDEELLPYFHQILQEKSQRQLIVIHLLGSHFRYNARYPEKFCRYQPSLQENTKYNAVNFANKQQIVNSYDNSIYYTDSILGEIIRELKATDAVASMVYISDHAENLYDDERMMVMHGNTNPSTYEVHIPFFFWYSDKYLAHYPEKVSEIEQHKDQRISTRNLFYSFLSIADITHQYENQELDITSPAFKADSVWRTLSPDKRIIKLK